jgi:hypothetical protein
VGSRALLLRSLPVQSRAVPQRGLMMFAGCVTQRGGDCVPPRGGGSSFAATTGARSSRYCRREARGRAPSVEQAGIAAPYSRPSLSTRGRKGLGGRSRNRNARGGREAYSVSAFPDNGTRTDLHQPRAESVAMDSDDFIPVANLLCSH